MTDEFATYRRSAGGVSYTDVGQGPVTLFVHGVFTNGRLWRNCVRLMTDRRCISVDLPGHGHTRPAGEASVWGLADAVGAVIEKLDLRDVHLVGNDTGGAVSQVVLTREPSRFATFALTNCDTEGNFPPPAFRPAVWAAKTGLLRLMAGPLMRMPTVAKQIYRTGYQNVSAVPDDVIADYLTPILGNADGVAFMTALLSSMTPEQLAPIRPLLQTCEIPTAIIWGTGDIFFKRRWADWLVDLIPGAKTVTEIPGGRLFFPDERAPELVRALQAHWGRND